MINKKTLGFVLVLAGLAALFLALRVRMIGHILNWDEAWNIMSLRAYLQDAYYNPFRWNYFFHPPIYMWIAALLDPLAAGIDIRLEMLSLGVSVASLAAAALVAWKIGGRLYAAFTAFMISVMPVSIVYSTWIKRDTLSAFFGCLAFLFLLKKKYFWCFFLLGLSMLSKESALFFILAAGLYMASYDRQGLLRKILFMCGMVFLVSGWWHIFFSTMSREVAGYFLTDRVYGDAWKNGPLYYFNKLMDDMGPGGVALFAVGLFSISKKIVADRCQEWSAPVMIFLSVYVPASFIFHTKTPWLMVSAIPALGMIAGAGALALYRYVAVKKILAPLFWVAMVSFVATGAACSYSDYFNRTLTGAWDCAQASKDLAEYLNAEVSDKEKLLITPFAYWDERLCPIFFFHYRHREVIMLDGTESMAEITGMIEKYGIRWFVICDSPDDGYNFHGMVKEATRVFGKEPHKIWKWVNIWRVEGNSEPASR